ncbi:GNAT family N-acetyltransferase [Arthrobacter castelli]|uniref:GNAT family N-acetyltransferase n=1 Tax=Arthrobacter castelli TaxID=271431 RepID=UPI0006867BDC|nr:GNAT family N-acetyltransferase [Arthrobacter castelli]
MTTSFDGRPLAELIIRPAAPDRWDDIVQVFGRRASNPDSCWCQRFRTHDEPSNRDALQGEVDSATVPIGLLAYLDDVPIGWTRVVPRATLPGILKNRALRRVLDDDPDGWWVTCFAVRPEHHGIGVSLELLRAAAEQARTNGASVLEGHPVDVKRLQASRVSASALFTGVLTTFESAGFREIGRTYPSRPVMRLQLHSGDPD